MFKWFQSMFGVVPEFIPEKRVAIQARVEPVRIAGTLCHQLTMDDADKALFAAAINSLLDKLNAEGRYVESESFEKYAGRLQ